MPALTGYAQEARLQIVEINTYISQKIGIVGKLFTLRAI